MKNKIYSHSIYVHCGRDNICCSYHFCGLCLARSGCMNRFNGNTFLAVNSSLLASSKKRNLIGPVVKYDGRSLAAKRRKLAQMKGTDVMIELLKQAQSAGHHADYVLFDT